MKVNSGWTQLFFWITAQLTLFCTPYQFMVMAVDRSKFRTCEQTSFCRRHRHNAPKTHNHFFLEKSSIQFSNTWNNVISESDEEAVDEEPQQQRSLWQSLFGSSSSDTPGQKYSSHVGPKPMLTGKLVSFDRKEELSFSLYVQKDGVARFKIKETMEFIQKLENVQKKQERWTSDYLVLKNSDEDKEEETSNDDESNNIRYIEGNGPNLAILNKYIQRLDGFSTSNPENYVGLQYDSESTGDRYAILIRLDVFELHMFEDTSESSDSPLVSINAQNFLYFEQRRSFKHDTDRENSIGDVSQSEVEDNQIKNEDKEIVGYWEDGKAIYSDGSRDDYEEHKQQDEKVEVSEDEEDIEGLWEEKFHSHKDTKPHGPMSVGMDISFPASQHLYGIPEHASSLTLKNTIGEQNVHYTQPYRLYNLDVFEYELDETMALYGAIPFMISHRLNKSTSKSSTVGVFWFNPTESFIDVYDTPKNEGKGTHWMSESGIIDVFLLPSSSKSPKSIYKQYADLTGYPYLPPAFSLGYHQCRWNYRDENDVDQVHENFEKYNYPYDVLWLDIEHTDGKRYFTWDKHAFPTPVKMQEKLKQQGRNMVTIVDPHIKRDGGYYVHKEASKQGLYIKDKDGNDFDGWCWPGASSYPDFTNEKVREWWATQFQYKKYAGSTPSLYTWNDMNEPSVFNGPEVSMQKDCLNLEGIEHREWHNLYGMMFHKATQEGQITRNDENFKEQRPFVLSRSFFAGSQQYGPIWTGDNEAKWEHLQIAAPMLLSLSVAGLPFVGADVGGFFGNPSEELLVRWNQAAAYQPFFRGHAHHDSKRREPWVFGDEVLQLMRKSTMARYALLPFWYTLFWDASVSGIPMMRPMWMEYPEVEELFDVEDQYLVGSDILVKPITKANTFETEVMFPSDHDWYDVDTHERVSAVGNKSETNVLQVSAPSDKIPVYQRGGSIITRKLRLRRSSALMYNDPYTLYIALDSNAKDGQTMSKGILYMDDESSFKYQTGDYAVATFELNSSESSDGLILSNEVSFGSTSSSIVGESDTREIERIVVLGMDRAPKEILVENTKKLHFEFFSSNNVLTIRAPKLSAVKNWSVEFSF